VNDEGAAGHDDADTIASRAVDVETA